MTFMATEAALGAGLVLFRLVADNPSVARAIAMIAHLANTFLLLASITLTAHWLSGGANVSLKRLWSRAGWPVLGLLGIVAVGKSGAIAGLVAIALRTPVAHAGGFGLRARRAVVALVVVEIGAGFLNLWLLAPVWMQIGHLLVADLLWISMVLLTAAALAPPVSSSS